MTLINHIIANIYNKDKIKNINDIPNLMNSMFTIEKKKLIDTVNIKYYNNNTDTTNITNITNTTNMTNTTNYKNNEFNQYFLPKQKDTLFWCLYILKYGLNNYNSIQNYGVTELNEKSNCVKFIDSDPLKLKTSNVRITNLNIKEIKSELMTVQTTTSFHVLVSFIFFYKCNIFIVHNNLKMYIKFTNETSKINHIIIKDKNKYRIYKMNASFQDIINITSKMYCFNHFDKPIKGMSTYKLTELYDFAKIFNIDYQNMKKQELYDSIRMQLIWDDK